MTEKKTKFARWEAQCGVCARVIQSEPVEFTPGSGQSFVGEIDNGPPHTEQTECKATAAARFVKTPPEWIRN